MPPRVSSSRGPRSLPRRVLAAGCGLLLAILFSPPVLAQLEREDRTRLARGETVVQMADHDRAAEGRSWRVLPVPMDRVLRGLRDYRYYFQFMPFMVRSDPAGVLEGDPTFAIELDLDFPLRDRRYRIRVVDDRSLGDDGRRIAWEMIPGSGNMQSHQGSWRVEPWPGGGTLVSIHTLSHTGGAVPVSWQREALEESLPWVLDGLVQHLGRCRYDRPVPRGCDD